MTRQEKALLARALNETSPGLRATSETLHLFSEAQIARAREIMMRRIDRKPRKVKRGNHS